MCPNSTAVGDARLAAIRCSSLPRSSTRTCRARPTRPGDPTETVHGIVAFLIKEEVKAILSAQDKDLWLGRRVTGLFTVAVQTGLRLFVSAEPSFAAPGRHRYRRDADGDSDDRSRKGGRRDNKNESAYAHWSDEK